MNSITYHILERLRQGEYVTAAQLSQAAGVSERTVRSYIKELSSEMAENGARLIAKPKYGYLLEIRDQERYMSWYRTLSYDNEKNATDRVIHLLLNLMNRREYVRMDDLCEELYVSRGTLSADIKQVEYLLTLYNLQLERRPNYGIRIQGKEMSRRRCLAKCLIKWEVYRKWDKPHQDYMQALAELVLESFRNQKLRISETSLNSLLIHFYVALHRIRNHFPIEASQEDWDKLAQQTGSKAWDTARTITDELSRREGTVFSDDEILYFAIHIGSRTSPDSSGLQDSNLVISSRIDAMVVKMLATVYESMGVDFRDNLELRMSLNQHLVSFDIRMCYGIPTQNPLLSQFKREYGFAYMVAASACTAIQGQYAMEIPEDEVGYIATLFALALEKRNKPVSRKNIVIVCSTGRGSAQLFVYRYKQRFREYINNIYECSAFYLSGFDFRKKEIDYVFTTVPLNVSVPVPVLEISMLLNDDEVGRYRRLFESDEDAFLYRFYDRDLFLPHITATEKEEILRQMCSHVRRFREIPEDFEDSVFLREQMGQTDFGNLVAIPHPQRILTKDCFAVVGLLDQPVWWGHYDVQAVFLTSHSEEQSEDIERFYDRTAGFLCNEGAVRELLEKRDFETLIRLLKEDPGLPQ